MIVQADARRIPLRDGCVQCVVTSPPYFGLRDYGTARWDGGDPACDHSPEKRGCRFATPVSGKQASNAGSGTMSSRDCPCGARRIDQQIGLEPSPDAYVAQLVGVFREVRRVLKDDGVVWCNLGDSYNSIGGTVGGGKNVEARKPTLREWQDGLKPKDLIGIPWMVAFALRSDGWYLRSDIIWSKGSCMPESVSDRPTRSHEYVFLLSKQSRYFYDADAVREPLADASISRTARGWNTQRMNVHGSLERGTTEATELQTMGERFAPANGRNLRSVWRINSQPYKGSHFATMPEKLAERCILAGSRPGDLVLDPFGGSGTTVRVARRFNRRGVMLDLNLSYLALAEERTSHVQASLLHVQEHTA